MLTQTQITKIRKFFSTNIIQLENVDITYEHVQLLNLHYINPSSIHALQNLWQDVDLLTESKKTQEEEYKNCINNCKCC